MTILSSIASKQLTKDFFEHEAWRLGMLVCGIDEAGRGPLAGPVVVAAAVLPTHTAFALLKDSKKMTEAERDIAYAWIVQHAQFSVVVVDHHEIDERNIYQATKLAMQRVYVQMVIQMKRPELLSYVLVDAMPLTLAQAYTHSAMQLFSFPFAESKSSSVAAASIVAKVTRDRLMKKLSGIFPLYQFERHKGYGTARHGMMLAQHGHCLVHRKSFIKKYLPEETADHEQQATLF